MRTAVLFLAIAATAQAQWDFQTSNTTASLRGIHALGNGIAWASGTEGTVLHTTDNGAHWQRCATPPDADKLDFRGIQAFDANTAIVMSSGKGDLSRLYKTTDACKSWKLIFTNPDKDGFWDAIVASSPEIFDILGDPVQNHFVLRSTNDGGEKWFSRNSTESREGEGAFAASNSSLINHENNEEDGPMLFATGGPFGARIFHAEVEKSCRTVCPETMVAVEAPMFPKSAGAGVFSIAEGSDYHIVAVGGDYQKPRESNGTAAFLEGKAFRAATTPPHGYRSAVAYDVPTKTWITVGPNGTDISTDDGRNWRALKPLPGQAADADQHWNALSLPFVVGPHGRIGILNPDALKPVARP